MPAKQMILASGVQKKGEGMKIVHKLRSSVTVNIVGAIVMLLLVFGIITSTIGFISFTNAFKREYAVSTYHMVDTAASLIHGDHIDDYLNGKKTAEYRKTKKELDTYCRKMNVSLLYLIKVDTSDYGRFVSIFNSVNNSVDDSDYTEWELGYQRDTTNEEYRQKYKSLYDKKASYETIYRIRTNDGHHPHITTMVPVKNSSGDVVSILCIQRPIRELNEARRPYLINIVVLTILLALLASVFSIVYIRKQFVFPLRRVANEASRFAKENTKERELGEISRYEELRNLADSIDTMETDMVHYIDNLTSVTKEKERIRTELMLATQIQKAILPHIFPPFPEREEFDLYATMDPAKEIGGDFYDFFLIDEDHLCMVMADVSGKGIPAALFMMVSKIIIQSCAMLGGSAGEILTKTNEAICSNNEAEMFVTVWLGILEISTGKLTAANAGHEYPVRTNTDGHFAFYEDKHGLVIGGMDGIQYKEYEMQLEPGTKLFLYTDGLPEATNAKKEMFGMERIITTLNQTPDAAPEEILANVRQAVDAFVEDEDQFDDLTMLCMEYRGPVLPESEFDRKPCRQDVPDML